MELIFGEDKDKVSSRMENLDIFLP